MTDEEIEGNFLGVISAKYQFADIVNSLEDGEKIYSASDSSIGDIKLALITDEGKTVFYLVVPKGFGPIIEPDPR
jgi:hypothetical protein